MTISLITCGSASLIRDAERPGAHQGAGILQTRWRAVPAPVETDSPRPSSAARYHISPRRCRLRGSPGRRYAVVTALILRGRETALISDHRTSLSFTALSDGTGHQTIVKDRLQVLQLQPQVNNTLHIHVQAGACHCQQTSGQPPDVIG